MTQAKRALSELILITVVGMVIGLAANGLNGKGVRLGTDYFPRGHTWSATRPGTRPATTATSPATDAGEDLEAAVEGIRQEGLQPIMHADVVALFKDPLYQSGAYVFVDDRKDQEYQHGHIPGAYQFYHYEIDRFIDEVLPACQQAIEVVTYCNGGDCEDSKFAALKLLEKGLDPGKLFVYPGGFTQWRKSDLSVERGARGSGNIVPGSKVGESHD